jgi:hypothetical protein
VLQTAQFVLLTELFNGLGLWPAFLRFFSSNKTSPFGVFSIEIPFYGFCSAVFAIQREEKRVAGVDC